MNDLNWEDYKKQGFLILKNFFHKEDVSKVLEDAKRVCLNQFINKKYITEKEVSNLDEARFNERLYQLFQEDPMALMNCGKQLQHLISLHRLSLDPKIENLLLSAGLRFPNISTRPVLYFNHHRLAQKKIFHKVDPHQDWRSMQGSLNSVVIWVPLVDVNKELGALEVIPTSHLNGLRTDHIESGFGMVNVTETEKFVSVELRQGDILLFSSFLIHQSGENVTELPRWSCHFRYNDLSEPSFIDRRYAHPYVYKPQEELLTPGFPTTNDIVSVFS